MGAILKTENPSGQRLLLVGIIALVAIGLFSVYVLKRGSTTGTPDAQAIASGHSVRLTWTASTTSDVAGYIVLRRAEENPNFTPLFMTPDPKLEFLDTDVRSGDKFVYVVVAVTRGGVRSKSSEPVSAVVP